MNLGTSMVFQVNICICKENGDESKEIFFGFLAPKRSGKISKYNNGSENFE